MPMLELKASFIVRPHLRDADAGNPMPQTQTHSASACVTSAQWDGWMEMDASGSSCWGPGAGLGLPMELRFRAYDGAQGRADTNQAGLTRRQNH